ncbi:MAG: response regulator, partial [Candidatus Wallbacteria bacterium]|nr:response regulator [Candidatus Wallbacteria bacterium]
TDIWMPGTDGMELLKRCREGYPEVEVILVTAQPSMPTVMEAIRREACSYLEKPFHSDELRQAVRRALARRRMLRMARHQLERDGAGPMGLDPTLSGAGSFFAAAWEFLPGETIIVDGSQRLVSANRAARARFNLGRRIKPRLREVPPLDRLCGMTAFAEGADRSTTVSQLRLDGKLVRAVWAEFLDGVKFCIVWFGG